MTTDQIEEAVDHFKKGEVVIFPTETVLGIGCIITDPEAIKKVYQIKDRPLNQPTHILTANFQMAEKYVNFSNPMAQKLAATFWPGPLTLVLTLKNPQAPYSFIAKDGQIGVRVPSYPELLTIIEKVGVPILGPSANQKGKRAPTQTREIDKQLLSLVDYTVNQDAGGLPPSTIVEVLGDSMNVIREGLITKEKINKALDSVSLIK